MVALTRALLCCILLGGCGGAAHVTGGGPARVSVVAEPEDRAALVGSMRTGLDDTDTVEAAEASSLRRAMVADLEGVRNASAHVYVDARDPRRIEVYFLFGEGRLYRQRLEDPDGATVVQRERLLLLVSGTLDTLREGAALGVGAREARKSLAAEGLVDAVEPASGWRLGVGMTATVHGSAALGFGGRGSAGYGFVPADGIRLDVGIRTGLLRIQRSSDAAETSLSVVNPEAVAGLRKELGTWWLGGEVSAGAHLARATADATAGYDDLGPRWDAEMVAGVAATVGWVFDEWGLHLGAGVQLVPSPVRYVVEGVEPTQTLLNPWLVRPVITVGVDVWP